MPISLEGQVCLITGASAGIGEACAKLFAKEKCTLILLARREERLQAVKGRILETCNVPIHTLVMDMSNMSEVREILSKLPEGAKEVDILVNNAGLALGTSSTQELDLDDTEKMLSTNVHGLITMTRHILPGMVARNRGHVFNIGSTAGHEAYAGGAIYCATKFAVRGFTDALRHDVCGTQIRVTAISPGAVETEFSMVRFKGDQEKADAVYRGIEPLTAEDIADHVHYAATRPRHVQIADIVTYATLQSGPKAVARVLPH